MFININIIYYITKFKYDLIIIDKTQYYELVCKIYKKMCLLGDVHQSIYQFTI
jgi:hypothetical protein